MISALILATHVSGHAAVLSFGTSDRTTRPREPNVVFRPDQGPTDTAGNRCVQQDSDDAGKRVAAWCKDSDIWSSGTKKNLKDATATVDEGYCLGWTPNTFMDTKGQGQFTSVSTKYMGEQKTQTFCPGDKIEVWIGVSQFHYGTHFIDMVPQSEEQIKDMPHCPNGNSVDWVSGDRMKNYPLPCYDPNANPVPAASKPHQKGAIRLSVPLSFGNDSDQEGKSEYFDWQGKSIDGDNSHSQFMVKTKFDLPHGVKYEAGPITFRWIWFCGVDVANGKLQHSGLRELWQNCIDARISDKCGTNPSPPPPAPPAPHASSSSPAPTSSVVSTSTPARQSDSCNNGNCTGPKTANCPSICSAYSCPDAAKWGCVVQGGSGTTLLI